MIKYLIVIQVLAVVSLILMGLYLDLIKSKDKIILEQSKEIKQLERDNKNLKIIIEKELYKIIN